ncbi:AmmeMemoRadiSam system radical SAM enzyme [Kiritimatiella glycovorans]|uniref:Pyruvate formate lyase-activating enzyme 1 n=1 Tax=Kiritimatiella glycovorans TaxID=1307763 RepID=A0A0G3EJ83_9BACT|nr:AmmeMemoRadiSam system radical SAM enzyme [Kiritimatiella glycovorans]AKJ64244.1 pyruvate formate lyase-activating enzyme 1 [Kiritimatiella glycovorans]
MMSDGTGTFERKLGDGRVQCTVCPHHCSLREGERGKCFVRRREDGHVVCTTYGKSSGFCIDPVEKKPLYHFLPGTPVLSLGTAGCNLSCSFCQNWHLSHSRQVATTAEEAAPEAIARTAERHGCRSVAFTYNEPVIYLEYAVDAARACRARGIRTVAVTAGYISPGARRTFFAHMDAANVDLKAFSEDFYRRLCGVHLKPVLDTLVYLKHETDVWLELTTLLIPGENDRDEELDAMTRWVVSELGPDVPLHFSAFHPAGEMNHVAPTSLETLERARGIARDNGLRFVYLGNISTVEAGRTYCPGCGARLIDRQGYRLRGWGLDEQGRCASCGVVCPGVFESGPGMWGPRCMPVEVG